MLTEKFYEILDSEIDDIIDRYKDYPEIARHKNVNQKKAYGFLVWFLKFYGHVSQFKDYITNGSDDASCDIIFPRLNPQGNIIYYVVQVKWFNRKNALGSISTTDVRKSLNDFDTIIRGEKQKSKNEKFNESHRALLDHLGKNGKVKFIFMALARENDDYKDNVPALTRVMDPIIPSRSSISRESSGTTSTSNTKRSKKRIPWNGVRHPTIVKYPFALSDLAMLPGKEISLKPSGLIGLIS